MSKQFKYKINGQPVTQEEFRVNAVNTELFKWFDSDGVNSVDFSCVEKVFDGDYKTEAQITEHLQSQLMSTEEFKKSKLNGI